MEPHGLTPLNTQIYEEACAWFVEFRGGDLDESGRRAFDRWLRKSPEHLSAYLEIAAIWDEGPALDPTSKWNLDTLVEHAASDSGNVVSLPQISPTPLPRHDRTPLRFWRRPGAGPLRRSRLTSLIVSMLLCAVAIGAYLYSQRGVYAAAIGEQRSIRLPDGSTVELNSRSKIRVRYTEHERDVDIIEGQALFHVAKAPARPFIVGVNGTRVRAVGTQFDVYRKKFGTTVTVVEGRVAVYGASPDVPPSPVSGSAIPKSRNGDEGAGTVFLSAGEQLIVTGRLAEKTDHANVAAATAWTQRQLVFESATLLDVAEEFNRYNERQLVIDDSAPYEFHISGVFSSTDPESLLRFLRQRPGIRVTETTSEIRVSRNNSHAGG